MNQTKVELNKQLLNAIEEENISKIEKLIRDGADINSAATPNSEDNYSVLPLHFAALIGYKDGTEILLKSGAEVNVSNNKGVTALHLAAISLCKDTVKTLLASGANPNAQNNNGETPLFWSATRNFAKCGKPIIDYIITHNLETEKPEYINNNRELSEHWDSQVKSRVKKENFLCNNKGIFSSMSKHSNYVIDRGASLHTLILDAENFLKESQKKSDVGMDLTGIIEYRVDRRYPALLKAEAFASYEEGKSRMLADPNETQEKFEKERKALDHSLTDVNLEALSSEIDKNK